MKIGILTYHLSHNYGAFLQAYALLTRLKNELSDDDIEIIDFNMKTAEKYYKKVILSENRFCTVFYNLKRYKNFKNYVKLLPCGIIKACSDSISDFQEMVKNQYDIIIAGSDEIWRLTGRRGFPNPYWLPGNLGCIKMSYAASSRSDFSSLDHEKFKQLKQFLDDFYYIGVRDASTYENVIRVVEDKTKVHINCDPTLAFPFEYNRKKGQKLLQDKFHIDQSRCTVGFMIADSNTVKLVKKSLGREYNYVSLFQKHRGTRSNPDITPFEWIDVISALDFFIVSFFHGICFAINTGIPFAAFEKNRKNIDGSKISDLLKRTGLENRFYTEEKINNGELKSRLKKECGANIDFQASAAPLRSEFENFLHAVKSLKNQHDMLFKKRNQI